MDPTRADAADAAVSLGHLETRPLDVNHLATAVSLASQAFEGSPSYKEIVPDPSRRAAFLSWLFERDFWLRLGKESARCIFDGDELVMFFVLEKPGLPPVTTWELLRAGLIGGFFSQGVGAMMRMLKTKAWFEAKEREVLGERADSVARLQRVTVLPNRQGQGIGSKALHSALQEADGVGLAVLLATQEERNVRFYRRLGFEVIIDEVSPLGAGYRNWMMLREPRNQ